VEGRRCEGQNFQLKEVQRLKNKNKNKKKKKKKKTRIQMGKMSVLRGVGGKEIKARKG